MGSWKRTLLATERQEKRFVGVSPLFRDEERPVSLPSPRFPSLSLGRRKGSSPFPPRLSLPSPPFPSLSLGRAVSSVSLVPSLSCEGWFVGDVCITICPNVLRYLR